MLGSDSENSMAWKDRISRKVDKNSCFDFIFYGLAIKNIVCFSGCFYKTTVSTECLPFIFEEVTEESKFLQAPGYSDS